MYKIIATDYYEADSSDCLSFGKGQMFYVMNYYDDDDSFFVTNHHATPFSNRAVCGFVPAYLFERVDESVPGRKGRAGSQARQQNPVSKDPRPSREDTRAMGTLERRQMTLQRQAQADATRRTEADGSDGTDGDAGVFRELSGDRPSEDRLRAERSVAKKSDYNARGEEPSPRQEPTPPSKEEPAVPAPVPPPKYDDPEQQKAQPPASAASRPLSDASDRRASMQRRHPERLSSRFAAGGAQQRLSIMDSTRRFSELMERLEFEGFRVDSEAIADLASTLMRIDERPLESQEDGRPAGGGGGTGSARKRSDDRPDDARTTTDRSRPDDKMDGQRTQERRRADERGDDGGRTRDGDRRAGGVDRTRAGPASRDVQQQQQQQRAGSANRTGGDSGQPAGARPVYFQLQKIKVDPREPPIIDASIDEVAARDGHVNNTAFTILVTRRGDGAANGSSNGGGTVSRVSRTYDDFAFFHTTVVQRAHVLDFGSAVTPAALRRYQAEASDPAHHERQDLPRLPYQVTRFAELRANALLDGRLNLLRLKLNQYLMDLIDRAYHKELAMFLTRWPGDE
ncbi:hypothetical protein HK405_011930 [Cladochytrium tenue]|nr:hypothetical protein HK405_011930 [Cladochytrium tenue]